MSFIEFLNRYIDDNQETTIASLQACLHIPSVKDEATVARAAIEEIEVEGDAQFPAGYRRLLLTTTLQRALETAAQRAEQRCVN